MTKPKLSSKSPRQSPKRASGLLAQPKAGVGPPGKVPDKLSGSVQRFGRTYTFCAKQQPSSPSLGKSSAFNTEWWQAQKWCFNRATKSKVILKKPRQSPKRASGQLARYPGELSGSEQTFVRTYTTCDETKTQPTEPWQAICRQPLSADKVKSDVSTERQVKSNLKETKAKPKASIGPTGKVPWRVVKGRANVRPNLHFLRLNKNPAPRFLANHLPSTTEWRQGQKRWKNLCNTNITEVSCPAKLLNGMTLQVTNRFESLSGTQRDRLCSSTAQSHSVYSSVALPLQRCILQLWLLMHPLCWSATERCASYLLYLTCVLKHRLLALTCDRLWLFNYLLKIDGTGG